MANNRKRGTGGYARARSSADIKPSLTMTKRLNRVVATLLAAFAIYITIMLGITSIAKSDFYQELANAQQLNSISIKANRGTIYDSNGEVLAQSATVWTVFIDPTYITKYESDKIDLIADKLSQVLGVDREEIIEKTKKENQYEEIKREVEKEDVDEILAFAEEQGISGIYTTQGSKRYYPNGVMAASIIGFTNYDGDGAYGIEAYYDDYLSGVDGKQVSLRDSLGNEMPYRYEKLYDAENGNDIYLTIDSVMQNYLEKNMQDCVDLHQPDNRACAIMMNPKTGRIYAMATTPGFDLTDPFEIYSEKDKATLAALPQNTEEEKAVYSETKAALREGQWKNKCVTELYYPGSVFKTVTVASALEEKVVSLNDTFYCSGVADVAGTKMKCWQLSGHGTVDLVNAVATSCNPAHIEIGLRMGAQTFFKYFKAFGFTELSGIDLPGEAKSFTVTEDSLGVVELASSAFGQTNKITPIQMITAVSATINGGYLVTPYVVDKIVDSEGNIVVETKTNVRRQAVSEDTSETMRYILESVVSKNGGKNAYIEGYRIGGKTGTSQKQDSDLATGRTDYVASFCGFAPANDPDLIMLVMVDTPTGGAIYGSVICAPVVSATFKEALPYLGHYPEYSDEQLANALVSAPVVAGSSYMEAKSKLSEKGLSAEIIGNGDTVIMQYPNGGTSLPKGSTVLLYTEEGADTLTTTVPDVRGLSPSEANAKIAAAGLNPYLTGVTGSSNATAQLQSLEAGSTVLQGTVMEVNFVVVEEIG